MTSELLRRPVLTRGRLVDEIRALGIEAGGVVMVHCSLSSLGYVVGGADVVVAALMEVLSPTGTLVAMTGWEHDAYDLERWPTALRQAYRSDPPAFDPELSEAQRDYGRLAERIRTWPGARHSDHPEGRFSAIGARAGWITSDHPRHHAYGPGSPLAKLVETDGRVLMLGAPLETITLLHHAEELARVPNKTLVRYSCPVATPSGVRWIEIEDIETSLGALPYHQVVGERDAFEVIAEQAIEAGVGVFGKVGQSRSHLFPAPALAHFAVSWIEKHFA